MKSKARTFLGTADEHLKGPIDSVVVVVGVVSASTCAKGLLKVRLFDEVRNSRRGDDLRVGGRSEEWWRMKRVEKSWMRGSLSVFPDAGLGAKPCQSRLPMNGK